MQVSLQSYLSEIEKAVGSLELKSEPKQLYEPIAYFLSLGGKRIRPILALIGSDLYKGDRGDAVQVALCIELFHNFTLVHDDIMDEAPLRRGKPTVHKKWNENVGILSGDAMLIQAYDSLSKLQSGYLPQLLKIFNDTAFKVCEGQQYDMDFETMQEVKMENYLRMIEYKTSVLLGAALQMGAVSAGADTDQADYLYQFGLNIGMAFQLKDDWLDVYGDPEKFGKTKGGDILASKKTFLMIEALESADNQTKEALQNLLSLNSETEKDRKLNGVIEIYDRLKVGDVLRSKMDGYYQNAMTLAAKIEGERSIKTLLLDLSASLMERDQ